MFQGCKSLTEIDASKFDTSKVTGMRGMFNGCELLTKIELSSFDTSNVTNISYMFNDCSALTELDLSSFDFTNVSQCASMLSNIGNNYKNSAKIPVWATADGKAFLDGKAASIGSGNYEILVKSAQQ